MNLAVRNSKSQRSFILLAPANPGSAAFRSVSSDPEMHAKLIVQMQRLRGRVYLRDGAIQPFDLTADGRHVSSIDNLSWHLLTMTPDQRVMGCARFHQHSRSASYQKLNVSRSSLAKSLEYGDAMKAAIESEMAMAREEGLSWVEVGGWALDEELRGTTEALMYVLATYAWSQLMGGAVGVSTVTERNGSASILRRLGGQSLHWNGLALPPYYDEHYRCTMELLRFDLRFPAQKYIDSIKSLRFQIAEIPVYCPNLASDRAADQSLELHPTFLAAQMSQPALPWTESIAF